MVKTPGDYPPSLPDRAGRYVSVIHKAIRAAVPKLKPDILHVMLGYGPFHYKHASGHEGDWFVVGLASQKNYVSRYICACDKNGYLAEKNKSRLRRSSRRPQLHTLQEARRLEFEGGDGVSQESRGVGAEAGRVFAGPVRNFSG